MGNVNDRSIDSTPLLIMTQLLIVLTIGLFFGVLLTVAYQVFYTTTGCIIDPMFFYPVVTVLIGFIFSLVYGSILGSLANINELHTTIFFVILGLGVAMGTYLATNFNPLIGGIQLLVFCLSAYSGLIVYVQFLGG